MNFAGVRLERGSAGGPRDTGRKMSGHLSYELRTYIGGNWKVDSIYDDLRIALYEAKRMCGSGRYSAVRLVEERFNPASGNYVSRTVFRGTKADGANAEATDRKRTARRDEESRRLADEVEFEGEYEAEYEDEEYYDGPAGVGAVSLTLRLGLILLGGIVAILAVHQLFEQVL